MNTVTKTTDQPANQASKQNWRRPLYDVSENEDGFSVRVNLPGVSKDGVDISLEEDVITVTGNRKSDLPKGWRALRRELPMGDYRLSLRLNVPVNEDQIQARVENGVLDLNLPKAEEVKPRKIKIG